MMPQGGAKRKTPKGPVTRPGRGKLQVGGPNSFEIDEVALDLDPRNGARQTGRRAFQFLAVVNALGGRVAAKLLQPTVGAAIGVQHEDHAAGAVQSNGFANLFQDEFAFGLELWRCKALGAAGRS